MQIRVRKVQEDASGKVKGSNPGDFYHVYYVYLFKCFSRGIFTLVMGELNSVLIVSWAYLALKL